MRNNDFAGRDEIRARLQQALQNDDAAAFAGAFDEMMQSVAESVRADYEELRGETDSRILAARGVRQLTSEERSYYAAVSEAMKARDPKQALANVSAVLPSTTVDAVFDELQTRHPLLSRIDFTPSRGAVKLIMNANGMNLAAWGQLCATITQELSGGFRVVDSTLFKLSAFLPVCKEMLELGPEWLDRYVRETLYEAISNGLEAGIVDGTGANQPIGMTRQVGAGVTVTDGVYPRKAQISVSNFDPATVGNLIGQLAIDADGKPRVVGDVILLVNPQDYYTKVMPATTVMAPDGTYRSDVMPYPMTIIQTAALTPGNAVLGIANRYFAAAGTSPEGRIEYSDEYRFLEDERVYLIKVLAFGTPKDNNAFLYLDISGLQPKEHKVVQVDGRTPSNVATLGALKIGTLALTPTFAAGTITYTAATTNTSDLIFAQPTDASAAMLIKLGTTVKANGDALTWAAGENVVTVKVTAENGTTTKTYTVTVTKS